MIIITGENGFIASKLTEFLKQKLPNEKICGTSKILNKINSVYLDLSNIDNFNFSVVSENDIVIHTAAVSSPDKCNNDFKNTYEINVSNTIKFIERCISKKAKVIFFSSDTVYGERANVFYEDEKLSPLGKYAEMKAEVESYFYANKLVKIFHLSYVFDFEDKYMQYLRNCYIKNEVAEVFDPFDRSVVYMKDLLEAVLNTIRKWDTIDTNIVNLSGPKLVSREMLARYFSNSVKGEFKYKVISPPDIFFQARPRIINMQSKYLNQLLEHSPQDIEKVMQFELKGKL